MAKGENAKKPGVGPKAGEERENMSNEGDSKSSLLDIMPSKHRGPEGAPSTPGSTASAGGNETHISGDTSIEGKVIAKGELIIDGHFSGDIKSSSRVVVGTAGKVEGTVEAKSLVVSGRVIGNLKVQERLELLSTGELFGDMETHPGALIIEKGARLEGKCSMGLSPDQERKSAERPQGQSFNSPAAKPTSGQTEKKNPGAK